MKRIRLDPDDFAAFVIALAVLLGSCHGARASEPMHAFGPPAVESWSRALGGPQGLGIVLTPDTWEEALDRAELLESVAAERDALRAALSASDETARSLRDELAAVRAEATSLRQSLEASRATEFRLQKRARKRWAWAGWSFVLGAAAATAVDN